MLGFKELTMDKDKDKDKDRDKDEQEKTPFLDAYVKYLKSKPICLDVPGHKMGNFHTDLSRKISNVFAETDVNAPYGMDNLALPRSVIKDSQILASKAMHADHCFFSVNGTSGGILAMFIGGFNSGDKVILPRNVHKSVVNALILSGVQPVFITPDTDKKLGVCCSVSLESARKAMDENPDAKAIFVINPTYYGVVSNLREIVKEAHSRNMIVLCDEAHGSNFYFSKKLPVSAMDAGADMSTLSMHKNSGSLTGTSFVLVKGTRVNYREIKRALNMITTTSPNSLLLCSLDAARKEMVLRGSKEIDRILLLADEAREKINKIPGLHVYGKEYEDKSDASGRFATDGTKLVIDVTGLNMYGHEAYVELRERYNIQCELGEVSVVLALLGPGTRKSDMDTFLAALKDMSKRHYKAGKTKIPTFGDVYPESRYSPRQAYLHANEIIPLKDSIGRISDETVMAYPPGIPLLIPGEVVDENLLRLIRFYRKDNGTILKDTPFEELRVLSEEK